jgi:hypothetical protein
MGHCPTPLMDFDGATAPRLNYHINDHQTDGFVFYFNA